MGPTTDTGFSVTKLNQHVYNARSRGANVQDIRMISTSSSGMRRKQQSVEPGALSAVGKSVFKKPKRG